DTNQLILARVIQGIGGAMLTPQTLAMLTTIFPPQRRGAAFGIWGAVAGVAAVAGPTLGGFIVTTWGWRWIFYVNLPIGIAALAATFLVIPDIRAGRRHRLDLLGVFLPLPIYLQSALGLSALQAGLTVAPQALVAMVVAPWSGRLADKVGGKYILMAGLVLFAAGMSLVDWRAAPDSTWLTFLPAFIVAGFGM